MLAFTRLGTHGQFGNQIFQYCYLRSRARALGTRFYCPPWAGDQVFTLNDQEERAERPDSLLNEYRCSDGESGFHADALSIEDNTDILGYFQSEKYFPGSAARQWLRFRQPIFNPAEKYPGIDFNETVAVSLRLGDDYEALRDMFPTISLRYYRKALARLRPARHVVIVSDHAERARRFLRPIHSEEFVFIDGNNYLEDFYLLTLCRDNIIANSTFAWWGAWLNPNPGKVVIAPEPWFRPGGPASANSIIPESWQSLRASPRLLNHYLLWMFKFRLKRKSRHIRNRLLAKIGARSEL